MHGGAFERLFRKEQTVCGGPVLTLHRLVVFALAARKTALLLHFRVAVLGIVNGFPVPATALLTFSHIPRYHETRYTGGGVDASPPSYFE
jgi:hypothetical protein